MPRSARLAAALCLSACAGTTWGADWTLIGAAGDKASVKLVGVIAGWTQPEPLWQGRDWRLRLRHEALLAGWRVPGSRNLWEVGYSPVLRLERPLAGGARNFFVEASIGARVLSRTRVTPEHRMSTAFQFADMLGMGMQFGRDGRSTVGVRLQHLSNLGIKKPNPGIDFLQLYYTYRF